jgi:hypothetical protein
VRIALDAAAARPGLGLRLVPVGITYLVRHAFLSDVHVAVGEPVDVSAFVAGHPDPEGPEAVRALTARLEQALRALAVHIEAAEDERLVALVTTLVAGIRAEEGLDEGGQSPAERTHLVHRVLDAWRWARETDPEGTLALRQRIDAYIEERLRLGLGGERAALQHRGERRAFSGLAWWAFLVAGAPLAAYGLAVSLGPYALLRAALAVLRPTTYRIALFKLLGGAALFALCWTAATAALAWRAGPWTAALFAVTLLPSALFAHRYVTETRLHRVQWRSADTWLRRRRMARLRAEREAITQVLAALRQRYLTQTVAPRGA